MARTIYENFRYWSGPPLLAKEKVRARDGKTWKKGQPMFLDSGLWEPVATDGTKLHGLASQDVDTATSSSDVYIERISSTETRLAGYASSDTNDASPTRANNGISYGIHVASNFASVNLNETSNTAVVVRSAIWEKEPYMNDSTDSPGQVIFTVKATALE